MSRWRVALLALVVAALAGLAIDRFTTHPATPLASSGLIGVAEPSELASYQQLDDFAAAVGRKPDLVLFYANWGEPFRSRFAAQVHDHDGVPFVQLSPVHVAMAAIAAGRYDRYLRSYAGQVRRYGYPVVIGFAPEMNGSWDSWGWHRTSPATWVAAWRHVVTVFRRQAATNVTWLWTINLSGPSTGPIAQWWPGPRYVTWVGIDGYYFLSSDTYSTAFEPTITKVRKLTNLPILLSEVAIGQVAGQQAKIEDLFTGVRADHLLGFVWFDKTQHRGPYHQDWRLENHPGAVAAFRRQLRHYHRPAVIGLASIRPAG